MPGKSRTSHLLPALLCTARIHRVLRLKVLFFLPLPSLCVRVLVSCFHTEDRETLIVLRSPVLLFPPAGTASTFLPSSRSCLVVLAHPPLRFVFLFRSTSGGRVSCPLMHVMNFHRAAAAVETIEAALGAFAGRSTNALRRFRASLGLGDDRTFTGKNGL